MKEKPTVSIIVPVFNGESTIVRCIESLLNLNYSNEKYEIIIVDNNSTDNTESIIKEYPVKYIFEKKKGSYAARNAGIKEAQSELIAFTDSDCIVDSDWINFIVRNFENLEIGGVGGKIIPTEPSNAIEEFSSYNGSDLGQESWISSDRPAIVTANAAYRNEVLKEINYFDDTFVSGGDIDLGWRVTESGFKIIYEPKAVVQHNHRNGLKKLFKQYFKYGAGSVYLFKKHEYSKRNRFKVNGKKYVSMFPRLILHLLWRIITLHQVNNKKLYLLTPICIFIQTLGLKTGMIYGCVKYSMICL